MVRIARRPFRFRAQRNYIHTTDIYDFLLAGAEETGLGRVDGPVSIIIRKILRNHLEIHYLEPGDPLQKPENAVIDFTISIDGREIPGWFAETAAPVEERAAYDETPLWELTTIDGQAIRIKGESHCSPIEVVTALAVKLHPHLAPPPEGRKWLDVKLILNRPLKAEDGRDLCVEMVKRIGDRLTKSVISVPGEELGHIFFSLGAP